MQRNRTRNQKTIGNRFGTIFAAIGIAILLLAAMAPAVSAELVYVYNPYAKDVQEGGQTHKGLVYLIPHNALPYKTIKGGNPCGSTLCYKPYVGGVDQNLLNWLTLWGGLSHSDPQQWDFYSRRTLNANYDETILLVPSRYASSRSSYASEIYIAVYRR